ncbi:MAG: Gfo/Idh/MocA family oxidoreductase [Planctomycetota bacterium]
MTKRKKYVVVGTGGRCSMFVQSICQTHAEYAQLVGLCDPSPTRMAYWNRKIQDWGGRAVAVYAADDFDRMIRETKADAVIVTTMDCTHHTYIIRAMELGCDVITEKPMTIDAEKLRAIIEAVDRTGRCVRVAFNYRYMPGATLLRDVISRGQIGTPTLVDFMWTLDTQHGADYFRRWHREKDKSGGLLVHKSTHHFDLVNFWLASTPKTVSAMGDLKFYGRSNAEARGETYAYERYTDEPKAQRDPFALDLRDGGELEALYLEAENDSGYIRDRNVFGEPVTIEDTMVVQARYRSGALLSYSLNAYSPWEGCRVCITGTKGRVEWFDAHGSHIIRGQDDQALAAEQAANADVNVKTAGQFVYLYPMFGQPRELEIPSAEGAHGGGDKLILEQLFNPHAPPDPYARGAGHHDGAASILLGIAANESIATGRAVEVDTLFPLD